MEDVSRVLATYYCDPIKIEAKHIRRPGRWWKDQLVCTLRPIESGFGIIGAGTFCHVTRKYRGLTILTAKCPHCGLQGEISRVDYSHLGLYVKSISEE